MDWFDSLKQRLFGEAVQRSGKLHHGPLQRNAAFGERHAAWLAGGEAERRLAELRGWLGRERSLGDTAELHLFSDAKATGLQLQRPAHWPADALHHLLDLLRDRVKELGYRVQLSDLRIGLDGEHRERHYLKPALTTLQEGRPADQRYGNILLEAWGPQGEAQRLKVLATVYSDRLYGEASSGTELLDVLLAE